MMRRGMVLFGLLLAVAAAAPADALCAGDCGGDGTVTVSELITGVNIALGSAAAGQCPSFDSNGDGNVAVNELVTAVASALNGCPFTGLYTARIDVGDGETALIRLQASPDGSASGTLRIETAVPSGAALRVEIPFPVPLTGTIDLETGAYHLTGLVSGNDGNVPIDVSGILPDRPGVSGTLDLDIGPNSFSGPVLAGTGEPTPTRTPTRPAGTPTPTFTAMPASFPTPPGDTCLGGTWSLVFRNVSGANNYADLSSGLGLHKGSFTVIPNTVFGGGAVPCTLNVGDILRRVQLSYVGAGAVEGATLQLGRARGNVTFDYLEAPATNPLGTRGWRADSGRLVIDKLDGTTVRFHITDAVLSPEPSFSFQTPATGTITIDAGAAGTLTQP